MLARLRLRDFRLFESLDFEPHPHANFLLGDNAQGKTSILEAVCLLLRLQSPRTTSPAECVRFGAPGFGIDGQCNGRHLHLKWLNRLKHFSLDSKPQSATVDYLSVARVAWIANSDLALVSGGGSPRRRYLDFLGAQIHPGYLQHLRNFERALRARNAALKYQRPPREVASFNAPLAQHGEALRSAREAMADSLADRARDAHRAISGSRENLKVSYRPGWEGPLDQALVHSRDEETRLRHTVAGPHRDDLSLLLDDRPASTFGSEGQQRSVALALKIAQAARMAEATTTPPIYLIDDIFGELDPERRRNVLHLLPSDTQLFITATACEWIGDFPWPASGFRVERGTISPLGW